jgi:asparagine synthase (glutamine-hydrolysing)
MCGIVGIYHPKARCDKEKLVAACKLIQHRGPDASNVFVDSTIGFGHQRLKIIDLSDSANQPMADPDGRAVLVFNGEIYNYRELRQQLVDLGHEFRTSSDTEVLLHMYLQYGERCLSYLRGMFAFAVWDMRNRSILLARDRLGIKPLYYIINEQGISFASEIKALFALGCGAARIDEQALHDYLTFRYTVSPRTMFQGIEKLSPGHTLVYSETGIKIERYWALDFEKSQSMTDEAWIQAFRERFTDTVRYHMVSDVPVGVLLSGGLDSSVVAALAQSQLTNHVKTFCVAFKDGGVYDERPYARIMARHLGTDHYEIDMSARDFIDTLPAFVWHMDEPVADPASLPLFALSRLASQHVKVVLSGEGSDELLGGYAFWNEFKGYNRLKLFKNIPAFVREVLISRLNGAFFRSARLDRYLMMSRHPLSHYGVLAPSFQDCVFTEEEKPTLYGDAIRGCGMEDTVDKVRAAYAEAEKFEFLDQMLFVSMTQWLPEDLLVKADKMTMAHSLELRVPFLDHVLIDFATRIPNHLKVRKCGTKYSVKYILKKAFSDLLPREIVERDKLGFPVPYAKWFHGEMRDMLHDVLLSESARSAGILNPRAVEGLLNDFFSRPVAPSLWDPQAKKIWSLFILELWREQFQVAGGA